MRHVGMTGSAIVNSKQSLTDQISTLGRNLSAWIFTPHNLLSLQAMDAVAKKPRQYILSYRYTIPTISIHEECLPAIDNTSREVRRSWRIYGESQNDEKQARAMVEEYERVEREYGVWVASHMASSLLERIDTKCQTDSVSPSFSSPLIRTER